MADQAEGSAIPPKEGLPPGNEGGGVPPDTSSQPPPYSSTQPPPPAPYPSAQPSTNPPPPAPYPSAHPSTNPPPPAPGYPPQPQPGVPQQQGVPPPPGAAYGAYMATAMPQLAQNLPPAQVTWMPLPEDPTPPGCPPGLEYLAQIDQILIHQQIELFELVSGYETENKYRVRNTLGQQVYFAAENSSVLQRQCCGPGRAFSMSVTDNSQKEVIHLERPLRCYCNCSGATCYCCLSCCLPHTIEVQAPPGTVIGYVTQDAFGILRPWFSIQNAEGDTVLKIKGPVLGCSCYSDANFDVLSADGAHSVGRISKQWSGLAKELFTDADNFGISFPMDLDVKMKAVMLGACFLIDFMFFEQPAGQNRRRHHHRHY